MIETTSKNIFFVHCDIDFFRENFQKKKNSEVIIYSDIERKMASREIAKSRPNQETVQFNISKRISAFLASNRIEFLYYFLDSIKKETIQKINRLERMDDRLSVFLMIDDRKLFDRMKKTVSHALLIEDSLR